MKSIYMTILALFSLAWLEPEVSVNSASREEAEFVTAAYSRLVQEFAAQQQADAEAIKKLQKEENWAKQRLADASVARRSAEREAADKHSVYGDSSKQSNPSAQRAAEVRLDKAADREEEAKEAFQSRYAARKTAEEMAKENEERRRGQRLEMSQLASQFGASPTMELAQKIQEKYEQLGKEYGIYCEVTWKTSPRSRALISYQTKRNRERGDHDVLTLLDMTETKESIPMGIYYVWATRDGRVTSDRNRLIPLTQKSVVVTVMENR